MAKKKETHISASKFSLVDSEGRECAVLSTHRKTGLPVLSFFDKKRVERLVVGLEPAGPSFAVVFVLTGSTHKLDFPAARAVLAKYGAGGAPLLVEPDGQNAVMRALATSRLDPKLQALMKSETGQSLPCNLLVDRGGRIRGRSFGAKSAGSGPAPHQGPMTETDKAKLLTQHSKWATPAGGEFIAALAAGALEKA